MVTPFIIKNICYIYILILTPQIYYVDIKINNTLILGLTFNEQEDVSVFH